MVAVVPTVLQGAAAASVAGAVAAGAARTVKPLVVSWCPRPGTAGEAQAILTAAGVPNFPDPVRCVAALAGVVPGAAPPAEPTCAPLREGPARTLAEHEALALLRQAGVPVLPSQLAATPEQAEAAARALGGRVALKVQSPDIPHKTDAGGVALDLAPQDAGAACARILAAARGAVPGARIEGVLVQPMARGVAEVIVGIRNDAAFGPAVLVGLGGVAAEALEDVQLMLAPVAAQEARAMLGQLRGIRLLRGFRGAPAADEAALAEAIVTLSAYALRRSDVLETLEINPLLVLPAGQGVVALDALATLRGEPGR
jgi:acetate---CoA ligase (ADP-forming)